MDWSTKLVIAAVATPLLSLLFFICAIGYSMWLHERDVAEPEKQVALLLRASFLPVPHVSVSRKSADKKELPPAA
jgi:hypothetical protein